MSDWPRPAVTCDVALLTDEADPRLLLIRRAHDPDRGKWAFPGGFVDVKNEPEDQGEDLIDAAWRELEEETSLTRPLLEAHGVELVQVGAVGTPFRDPRSRVITIVWTARVPSTLVAHAHAGDDAAETRWVPLSQLDRTTLAFDHATLLELVEG